MVQVSTLVVAAFAIAPVLAVPLHHGASAEQNAPATPAAVTERSIDIDVGELDARDPFSFKKAFRKFGHIASKVGGVALKAAPLLLLREDGTVSELDLRDLILDDSTDLETREPSPDPKFNFKKFLGGAGKVAFHAAKLFIRDEEGNVYYIRELDADDFASGGLEAREPKFRLGTVNRAASTAQALGLREFDEVDDILEERDLLDLEGEMEELDARNPDPFNIGGFFDKAKGAVSRVLKVADQVSSKAHGLGLRELDDVEFVEARSVSIDDLD